ncbi:RICIN domain-containing protein [Streptomyces atroolivaceus]|uniref:RICIN domain-containing protein n=1 Tax=Streptomyces atroolivaceus TaxID=66869 RepID=UPI000691E9D4|nr:RICIN domain-containing protein [Streptomyces atroolivaceus]
MREHRNKRKTLGLGALLTALLLAVGGILTGGLASPAGAATLPAAGQTYQLVVKKSGKCIDVPAASAANGVLLQQWGCTEGAAWQQFTLVADGSGKYRLVNRSSGKCVDVPGYSKVSGVQLQQWGCAGQTNQQWTLTPSGTDTYQTGGAAGPTVTVRNYADLAKYVTASGPYVIKVAAAITVSPYGHEIPVKSDKTIIGVGTSGQIVGGGFFLGTGVHNVIIRNLTIRDTRMTEDDPDDKDYDYDGIQMDTADHVWIDHNRVERMNDGLIDSRKDTSYLTVSWNVMGEQNKAFGIGWTDNVTARMTIHHNWIHDTNQRNPSIDNVAFAHLYNNYMQNVKSYGNLSRGASKTVIENTYYQNVANPYNIDTTAASLTQTGSICVSCTGEQRTNGTTFKPSDHYGYTLDPAADVPALLKQYAGPQSNIGG